MKAHFLIAAAAATAALGLAAPAMAADKPNTTKNCFRSGEWQSWRGADANTIYLRISAKEFYRLDLSSGSNMVTDSSNHLVSKVRAPPGSAARWTSTSRSPTATSPSP